MEIRIGVQQVAREIVLESTMTADEIDGALTAALADGGVLRLTDEKGKTVLVPGRALGYVHVGESEKGKVGFGAS